MGAASLQALRVCHEIHRLDARVSVIEGDSPICVLWDLALMCPRRLDRNCSAASGRGRGVLHFRNVIRRWSLTHVGGLRAGPSNCSRA